MDGKQPTTDGLDRLLSARSVCRLIDTTDRTLRRWIAGGVFPPADLKIGTSLRWRVSTVQAFICGTEKTLDKLSGS